MVTQNGKDGWKPGWVPLRQAVFENYALDQGKRIDLGWGYSNVPQRVELDVAASTLNFIFRDGLVVEEAPWSPREGTLFPRNGNVSILMRFSAASIWRSMLE